jgi:hypothetical protein
LKNSQAYAHEYQGLFFNGLVWDTKGPASQIKKCFLILEAVSYMGQFLWTPAGLVYWQSRQIEKELGKCMGIGGIGFSTILLGHQGATQLEYETVFL